MKQEDKQYEKWLTEIKSNQPILENPEELTATILNRILRDLTGKETEKASHRSMGIRHCRLIVTACYSSMTLASLLSLTGQKCKMNMITRQTAFHYLTTGKKCDCWKRILILSSQYTQHRKSRKMQILQVIKEKRLK